MSNSDDLAAFAALGGELTLAEALDLAHATLTRYVVFPCPEAADAAALYAAATHAVPSSNSPPGWWSSPRSSAAANPAARRARPAGAQAAADLRHQRRRPGPVDRRATTRRRSCWTRPTPPSEALKGDEKAEHLRGILNAGFGRDRPYRRWDVTTRGMEDCATFAMAVLAGIGSLPDTIEDRAVIIAMRRKSPSERVAKYRVRRDKPEVQKAAGSSPSARRVADEIGEAEPDMPGAGRPGRGRVGGDDRHRRPRGR